jgi:hypothetical protein
MASALSGSFIHDDYWANICKDMRYNQDKYLKPKKKMFNSY